ncbi:MAG TPA: DUF5666 domain-containing protein [Terracidiphilus sp.]|nr:DUF5666 domain-containing protein [Terracidiphilus sp.]
MRIRLVAAVVLGLGITGAYAQDQGSAPQEPGQGQGRWQGRGARGGSFGMMGQGRGTMGTVTEVAADHYTIKTELGETYTVHYSVNTRIMKQPPRPQGARGEERGMGGGGNPPQAIKASDIKVGDAIAASGEVDANAKSVGAVFVMLIDPERAKQMREMEANYGKTWLAGRVTAINDAKVTLEGGPKNETQTFVADENTTFRKRRDPITLGDIHPGDMVRVDGAVKDGSFLATSVAVMGPPPTRQLGGGPADGQPAGTPPTAQPATGPQ